MNKVHTGVLRITLQADEAPRLVSPYISLSLRSGSRDRIAILSSHAESLAFVRSLLRSWGLSSRLQLEGCSLFMRVRSRERGGLSLTFGYNQQRLPFLIIDREGA